MEKAGYGAVEHQAETEHQHDDPTLLRRLIVAAVLAIPVIVLSMAMPMPHSAALDVDHRRALHPRGGVVGVAVPPSRVQRCPAWQHDHGHPGQSGSPRRVHLVGRRVVHRGHIYFEVAVTVTTFLLAGRYAEARAKKRAGEAVTALLKLGAKKPPFCAMAGGVHPDRAVGRR